MTMTTLPPVSPLRSIDEVLAVLASGQEHSEESVGGLDQLAHALQCAENLRRIAPVDTEIQAAGLLHDIGHLLVPGDDAGHGRNGADAVRDLLGPRVAHLIELHVPAKRYLVATELSYVLGLSDISLYTLVVQGGRMTTAECFDFESDPDAWAAVTLRRADEEAKTPGRAVPALDTWRAVLEDLRVPAKA